MSKAKFERTKPHVNIDGEWYGSLTNLSGTEGYWFITNEPVSFSYNPPLDDNMARNTTLIKSVPMEYKYKQSINGFVAGRTVLPGFVAQGVSAVPGTYVWHIFILFIIYDI